MRRTRFAPSPTGSLHVGNALSAVANRCASATGCCCGSTTPTRRGTCRAARRSCSATSSGSGIAWDEGPVRQSERRERHLEAGEPLGERFDGVTLLREDGSPTYHLASVVDDVDFGITHVVRGNDHRPNEALHRRLFEALGATPPEFVHHGLILGEDGKKLSKRAEGATVASLREAGIPAEAVRALPRGARPPEARRPLRPAADPPAGDRGDRRALRRGAGRARRRAGRARAGAARRARPERGARVRAARSSSPSR